MRPLLVILFAANLAAAAGKNDPKGEPRPDPQGEKAHAEFLRREAVLSRRATMALRLNLAGISEFEISELVASVSGDPIKSRELGRRILLAAGRGVPGATPQTRQESMAWLQQRVSELRAQRTHKRVDVVRNAEDRRLERWAAIGYDPSAPASSRLAAMAEAAVPATRENWLAWIDVSKTDVDPLVRRQAELRAIAASPCLVVTREFSEPYRVAFAKMDPTSIEGRRFLMRLAKRHFGSIEPVRDMPTMDDTAVQIATNLLRVFPEAVPANESLRERAWATILNQGAIVLSEFEFQIFDAVDFSSAAKAAEGLNEIAEEHAGSFQFIPIVRSLRWQMKPPAAGSFEALVRRRVEDLPLDQRFILESGLEPHFANPHWAAIDKFLIEKQRSAKLEATVVALRADIAFLRSSKQTNVDRPEAVAAGPVKTVSPKALATLGIDPKSTMEHRYQRLTGLAVTDASFDAWFEVASHDSSLIVKDIARDKIRQFDTVWFNQYLQGLAQTRTSYFLQAFYLVLGAADGTGVRNLRDPVAAADLRKRVEELRVDAQKTDGLAVDLELELIEEFNYLLSRLTPYAD